MATLKIRANELSGQTGLTVELYPPGGTIANPGGDNLTESNGLFSGTVAEALTGYHDYYVMKSGVPVFRGYVYCDGSDLWIADQPPLVEYTPVYRSLGDTNPIHFLWETDGETITGTVVIGGTAAVPIQGTINPTGILVDGVGQYVYELEYDVDDRPATADSYAIYYVTDGTRKRNITLVITGGPDGAGSTTNITVEDRSITVEE